MAVASWMLRGRNLSQGRSFRSRREIDEDAVQLDLTKDVNDNIHEILLNLCQKQGIPASKKLAYLNVLIKVLDKVNLEKKILTFKREDLLYCMRVSLVHEDTLVRAGGLRAIRHFITEPNDVVLLKKLNITTLIPRSIDILLANEIERVEALRLSQRLLKLSAKHFPKCIVRSLVSLANNDASVKDRMLMVTLTILCQLCILNPDILIDCDGHVTLLRNTVVVSLSRVNECIMGSLLYLLNNNVTRQKSNITLDYLNSVYCDVYSKKDEKGDKYEGSLLSMLAALRSFTGVLYLCQSSSKRNSVIKNVIDVLSITDNTMKENVLLLFYELFGLSRDNWTDDVHSAIDIIDPAKFQDSWRLSEGFVAAEGRALVPNLIVNRCNLREVHLTLILYCLFECNIVHGLVQIIVSSEQVLALHATVLLGYLLHLAHTCLPAELIDLTPVLPSLVGYITDGEPRQRQQALRAVSTLNIIHEMYKKRPAAHSLFLKQIVDNGGWWRHNKANVKCKTSVLQIKDVDYVMTVSKVLSGRDYVKWDWNVIASSLKCPSDSLRRLEDATQKTYIKCLLDFYRPGSNKFSNIPVTVGKLEDVFVVPLFSLVDLLLSTEEGESLLIELITDIGCDLKMNDQHQLENTCCQYYFLALGHLTRTNRGVRLLVKLNLMEEWLDLVSNVPVTSQAVVISKIKLLLSSLCYNNCPIARTILSKSLTSPNETVRVYSTDLLLVLARSNVTNFSKWCVELLVNQLYDESPRVTNLAVNIAHELCYDEIILESVIRFRPSLLHLGDKGNLLLIRFLSTPTGFTFLNDANFIMNELEKWDKHYNYRYVGLLEDMLHDALTLHRRGDDNKFMKRLTNVKHKWRDVFVLPHLYGQLVQHEDGSQLILQHAHLHHMIQVITTGTYSNKSEVLEMKACVWAVCNIGTSKLGVDYLEKENVLSHVVNMATCCSVLSLRATAFYCLNLMSSVPDAASLLTKYGWCCVQHDRCTKWPLLPAMVYHLGDDTESIISDTNTTTEFSELTSTSLSSPYTSPKCDPPSNKSFTLPPGFGPGRPGHRRTLSECQYPTRRRRTMSENCEQERSQRQTSVESGTSGSGTGQNLSFQDAAGLATLQSLHTNRRPEMTSRTPELEEYEFRRRFSSTHERPPCSLMCEFEAQYPPRLFSNDSQSAHVTERTAAAGADTVTPTATTQHMETTCDEEEQDHVGRYMGICLPKQLQLFLTVDDKSCSIDVTDFTEVDDEDTDSCTSSVDSTSTHEDDGADLDDNTLNKKVKSVACRRRGHDTMQCFTCCTIQKHSRRRRNLSNSSSRLRTETESSQGNYDSSPVTLKWRLRTQSESLFGSGEQIQSCDEPARSEMTSPPVSATSVTCDNNKARRAVLKHVTRMCNPVWSKSSRQALLELKQSNPVVYQDVCLYSDVCRILTNSPCKLSSRRLIQELFLDLSYEVLCEECLSMLKQYAPVIETEVASPVTANGTEELKTLYENTTLN